MQRQCYSTGIWSGTHSAIKELLLPESNRIQRSFNPLSQPNLRREGHLVGPAILRKWRIHPILVDKAGPGSSPGRIHNARRLILHTIMLGLEWRDHHVHVRSRTNGNEQFVLFRNTSNEGATTDGLVTGTRQLKLNHTSRPYIANIPSPA